MGQVQCGTCGVALDAGDKICGHCGGAPVAKAEDPAAVAQYEEVLRDFASAL